MDATWIKASSQTSMTTLVCTAHVGRPGEIGNLKKRVLILAPSNFQHDFEYVFVFLNLQKALISYLQNEAMSNHIYAERLTAKSIHQRPHSSQTATEQLATLGGSLNLSGAHGFRLRK